MTTKLEVGTQIKPLGDRILVKPLKREEMTRGGIVLPDTAQEKPQEGEVLAVGPGRLTDEGKRLEMEVKRGDRIIYAKYAGNEIQLGEEELLILRDTDILAVLG